MQALVETLQVELEVWKQKCDKNNDFIISTLIDRQRLLEGQLKERTAEAENATTNLPQRNEDVGGRSIDTGASADDPILIFVSQNPQFNSERKVLL